MGQVKEILKAIILGNNGVNNTLITMRDYLIRCGYRSKNVSRLENYRNIHDGEKCFIVGTGPSLTASDLDMINGQLSFSVNSIIYQFNNTNWRPTYYCVQDQKIWNLIKDEVPWNDVGDAFIGSLLRWFGAKRPENATVFPLDILNHVQKKHNNYKYGFSADANKRVYDGFSVLYSCVQLAVYMGFKEIYLLGADCNYNHEVQHAKGYLNWRVPTDAGYYMIEAYKSAKEYCDKNGIKIINCTRGGMLELFERKMLEEVV